jgi:O-antigen ligase
VKRALALLAALALLVGPAAVAFFSGGYFDQPRLAAGIVAWAIVVVVALVAPQPLPRSLPGRLSLLGLALLTALVGLSITWAPLKGGALSDFERLLLYLAVFAAAIALMRPRGIALLVEPLLALGSVVVVGYGLSERLLPGVLEFQRSASAGGRLQQPLTYWNAMGALAAIGAVLCVRIAGDSRRPLAMRAAAAACTAPLGFGLWLTFSRGALAAVGVGLVALVIAVPLRPQLRSLAIGLAVAVPAAAATAGLDGVRSYAGSLSHREKQGLAMLALLLVLMAAAAVAQVLAARRERADEAALRLPRRTALVAGLAVVAAAAALVAAGIHERHPSTPAFGATTQRLGSVESNRYEYWRVALEVFADHPIAGDGARSFQVDWLAKRKIADAARDAHSLYIETAAELGILGLICLGLFLGGAGVAAARAWRLDAAMAAGPIAACCAWLVHAGLDWDWEMPGVSLLALVLSGALVGWSELSSRPGPTDARQSPEEHPTAVAAADPTRA